LQKARVATWGREENSDLQRSQKNNRSPQGKKDFKVRGRKTGKGCPPGRGGENGPSILMTGTFGTKKRGRTCDPKHSLLQREEDEIEGGGGKKQEKSFRERRWCNGGRPQGGSFHQLYNKRGERKTLMMEAECIKASLENGVVEKKQVGQSVGRLRARRTHCRMVYRHGVLTSETYVAESKRSSRVNILTEKERGET